MKICQFTGLIIIMLFLCSCEQTAGGRPLDVSERSNEVAESNLNLGIAYLKRGEYEKSLDRLNKSLEADPHYTPTLNALGLLYQKLGDNIQAEQYYTRALGIRQNDANTLNNYGQFLCSTGRFDEAQKAFLSASNNPLYETPEISLTNAGTCSLKNDQPEVAEKFFRDALDKNPNVPIALIQMSQLSYEQGNYLSARGYLQRYLATSKHTPASLWLGIKIEQQLGDKNILSSYALLLKNKFPDSHEAKLLLESGIK
jgi:type IV pilus assembly protein PilF